MVGSTIVGWVERYLNHLTKAKQMKVNFVKRSSKDQKSGKRYKDIIALVIN